MRIIKGHTGGIELRIVFAIVTFIAIAIFLVFFINKKSENAQENHRKATLLSDKGIQIFMESTHLKILESPLTVKGIDKKEYQDGWYEVTVNSSLLDSICSVKIVSVGGFHNSKVSQEKIIKLVQRISDNDTAWIPYNQ